MEFYLMENGQQAGPFSLDELAQHHLAADTPVWAEGMTDWMQAGEVPELTLLLQRQQYRDYEAQHATPQDTPVGTPVETVPPTPPAALPAQPVPPPYGGTPPTKTRGGNGCLKWLIALLILVIIGATMVFTCPSRTDHVNAIKAVTQEFAADKIEQQNVLGGLLNDFLEWFTGEATDAAFDNFLDVDNHLLFSVGKLDLGEKEKTVSLGVFGHVFTFDKEDIEKAWADYMDKQEASRPKVPDFFPQQQDTTSVPGIGPMPDDTTMSALERAANEAAKEAMQALDSLADRTARDAMQTAEDWLKKQADKIVR